MTRKVLPDGRVLEFIYKLTTHATAGMTYVTVELVEAPMLDCSCNPNGPDDAAQCFDCHAVICVRRHAFTCMGCGRVFCSGCLRGLSLNRSRVVVCKSCAEGMTASRLKKGWKGLKKAVWGV